MRSILSIVAGLVFIAGFFPYGYDVVKRNTVPIRTSWFIWAVTETVAAYGMYTKGTLTGQIAGSAAGSWVIALLSLHYGKREWDFWNKVCAGGAVIGVILCLVGEPVLAIVASITCVCLASGLTIRSMLKDPSKESRVGWTFYWVSCLIAVPAIPRLTWEDALQPISFFVIDTYVMHILYIRPRPKIVTPTKREGRATTEFDEA